MIRAVRLLSLVVAFVSGIDMGRANTDSIEFQDLHARTKEVFMREQDCLRKSDSELLPAARILVKRFVFDNYESSQKYSITDMASDEEKAALLRLSQSSYQCLKINIHGWANIHPIYVQLIAKNETAAMKITNELILDRINIGEFNARRTAVFEKSAAMEQSLMEDLRAHQDNLADFGDRILPSVNSDLQEWTKTQMTLRESSKVHAPGMTVIACQFVQGVLDCENL